MANFCLMPEAINKFKTGFQDGTLDPEKLSNMSSDERHQLFSKLAGEDVAKGVNASFESKLLLKNQQRGMVTWAKSVAGLKPEVRRDLLTRINKLDKVLDPEERQGFLKDLAATKLGVNVSQDEAKQIANLAKTATEAKAASPNSMEYGRAQIKLNNYVNSLKLNAEKTPLTGVPKETLSHPFKAVEKGANFLKSIRATLDDSAVFHQGWKAMLTDPKQWGQNALKSFSNAAKEFKGQDIMDEVNAKIISDKNYDRALKGGLSVVRPEEAFSSSVAEKIPLFGRAFKASETAYNGFIHQTRMDIFNKYLASAEKMGANIDDPKQLKAIASVVNSLTGRGSLGRFEGAGDALNTVFFSPRNIKGHIDTIFQPLGAGGATTRFAKQKAATNLVKVIAGTASILAIADAVRPGSVESDPRSSDFGKIKIGNTRFDVTGGMSSILTLAARLKTQSSKSSSTGVVSKLNSGYGSKTGMDIINDFLENKLSPAGSIVKDLVNQKDFNGNKPTLKGEIANSIPLSITNYQELSKDPNAANHLVAMIADGLGVATNTYGKSSANWEDSSSQKLQAFKSSVGADKFKQAAQDYNTKLDQWNKTNNPALQKLSNKDKTDALTTEKTRLQDNVLKSYGFKYKAPKAVPTTRRAYNNLLTPK